MDPSGRTIMPSTERQNDGTAFKRRPIQALREKETNVAVQEPKSCNCTIVAELAHRCEIRGR